MMNLLQRLRDLVNTQILGLDDTPHRIAWGVALGCMVAFTPTLGLQIAFYLALAALFRANKVSGIPILFISNPVTAVPLYYFVWSVGDLVLHGAVGRGVTPETLHERLVSGGVKAAGDVSELLDPNFWLTIGRAMMEVGDELWVGALLLGLITAIPGYVITLRSVRAFRRAREVRRISLLDLGKAK